jgi:DNA-binding Lrp family transcriptional regulator
MGPSSVLDVKDNKILAELDNDARQSNSQIGKKVKLSKEVVKYRIDRLLDKGIIIRFHTVVNYFRLGVVKFKLYLRLSNADKEKIEEIGKYFCNHNKTEWVARTTGRWDMIIGFLVRNVNEFDDEIQIVFNKYSKYIQEKGVTTTLYLAHEVRGFLGPKKGNNRTPVVYHTSKDPQEEIDETDEEILRALTNNARIQTTTLATQLRTTPRVIQYRLKELQRKNIILAHRVHLDPGSMNRIFCKLIIYLSSYTKERLKTFISYASSIEGAVWPQRVMGSWGFELDMELKNYEEFQGVVLDLTEKFPDIIKNHEFCILSKEYKLDLYPNADPTKIRK